MTRTITIDLSGINTREGLHEAIRSALDLPDEYGNNFDALHDVLTSLNDVHLQFYGIDGTEEFYTIFEKVVEDSSVSNPGLTYEFIDEFEYGNEE